MSTRARSSRRRALLAGLLTYLPGARYRPGTGGSTGAPYCYAVWLRHLTAAAAAGVTLRLGTVVELGPGDSLGTGLAALLSGADRYVGLDVVAHDDPGRDLQVFEELVGLFSRRAEIPGEREFPQMLPRASTTAFPEALVPADVLRDALEPSRLDAIRRAIAVRDPAPTSPLGYVCPWSIDSVPAGAADLVFSQAVLQDIDADPANDVLGRVFHAAARWLRPGGIMSHQIDLAAPIGSAWNDHWAIGPWQWRLTRGRRPYYFNRLPLSAYMSLCDRYGFEVVAAAHAPSSAGRSRAEVGAAFQHLPDEDFTTSAVHLIARRRGAT